ncbi:MAG: PEPxxWA-CTERM sorting domain-containing protein [Polymorphobacter sp.]
MRNPGLLHLTSLVALVLAAAPAGAVTKLVNFSFTAGGTAAKGVYTLNCASSVSNCAVTALTGSFGGNAITLAPPPPPGPPPPVKPDNEVTQPGYNPSENGVAFNGNGDFWNVWFELTIDGGKTWIVDYDPSDYEPVGPAIGIEDYTTSVPEPASWALLVAGFGMIGTAIRRRTQRTAAGRPA